MNDALNNVDLDIDSTSILDIDPNTEVAIKNNEIDFDQPQLAEFYRNNEDDIQALFSCPITCFFPADPVVADDGNIYDEDAISTWHSTNYGKSPLTNQKITKNFQIIPLWNDIIKMFLEIDPDLKEMLTEKDYTYENNKNMLINIINDPEQHYKLLKYTGFVLQDACGLGTIGSIFLSRCTDIDILKHVISNSVDFNDDNPADKIQLINWFCTYSSPNIVKYFINEGYDIMVDNGEHKLPIVRLIENKQCNQDVEILDMISEKLKDNNIMPNGNSLLVYAVEHCSLNIIKIIVDNGNDVLVTDDNERNLLKIASMAGRSSDIILYLIEKIYEKNKDLIDLPITEDGLTIIHILLSKGIFSKKISIDNIKKLIQLGVNLEVENPVNKWRPIHYICKYGTTNIIEYVMGIGIDLTVLCYYEGSEVPPLALLDINGNIKNAEKDFLIQQFFQFIEIQNLSN